MEKKRWLWVVLTIAFLGWVNQGWADDEPVASSHHSMSQPSSGSGCKMMGGGMGHGKGMMQGGLHGGRHKGKHAMMQGKRHEGMGMQGGMGRQGMMAGAHRIDGMHGLMGHFHGWMTRLMANRQAVGLTPEQLDQIDLAMAEHRKFALRTQAEVAALRIDLKRELRKGSPDLVSIEPIVNNIAEQETKTEMEGIRLYASVINMFTPEQKAKVEELVGTPFPRPWERNAGSEPEAVGDEKEGGAGSAENPPGAQAHTSSSGGGSGCH